MPAAFDRQQLADVGSLPRQAIAVLDAFQSVVYKNTGDEYLPVAQADGRLVREE